MENKNKRAKSGKFWCYYCDREFGYEKILVQHQKAKHFKCHVCHEKLSSASDMQIHVLQVHKENVETVPNAIEGRNSVEIGIHGMEGIPPHVLAAHNGDDDDEEAPAKTAKIDAPLAAGVAPMPHTAGYHPHPLVPAPYMGYYPPPPVPSFYNPFVLPGAWSVPQPWYHQQPAVSVPQPHPLFHVQGMRALMPPPGPVGPQATMPMPVSQQLFPMPMLASQPFFPMPMPVTQPFFPLSSSYAAWNSHSFAPDPNTSGPSIGPPLVIENEAPPTNEVHLIWNDEAMSMEERRMALPKNQIIQAPDETHKEMRSIDAAVERQISKDTRAGRMVKQ